MREILTMSYNLNHIIHLTFLFVLVGSVFAAIAAPQPENRKLFLAVSGFCALVVMLSGFMLLGILKAGFPSWVIVKLVCWLVLSALVGMAFRLPEKRTALVFATVLTVLIAVTMVSAKPF